MATKKQKAAARRNLKKARSRKKTLHRIRVKASKKAARKRRRKHR
jgi:hypothetical protein